MRYIIVAALADETPGLEKFAPVVHTGVGKVNAAIELFAAISHWRPELIINYGTAGSLSGLTGLQRVDTILQHDMDVRPLGFQRGVTPFGTQYTLPDPIGVVLASGDQFIHSPADQLQGIDIEIDLVDMEAYALAAVASYHDLPFHCYKYVSDSGDENSVEDWQANVAKGANLIKEVLEAHYGTSSLLDD